MENNLVEIRDNSLDKSKKKALIVILVLVGLTVAWFVTNMVTKDALYHQ